MKKILLSIFTIAAMALSTFGQAPEGFKYQAVVRDAGNAILVNRAVGIQLTIQQGSAGGTAVYTETFAPTTNSYGLVNLEIGTGTTLDDFTTIDWANGTYFIETAIDVSGGTNYSVMGTSQLMSVPYALYAKTSGNGVGPQGPAGSDGIDGAPGVDGIDGINGVDGIDGAPGVDGTDGADGAVGPQGPAGTPYTEPTYSIGLSTELGGYVFWISTDNKHGLVAETQDQGLSTWYNAQNLISDPANHSTNGQKFRDWRLPTKYELNEMYLSKLAIGNFGGNKTYWSSFLVGNGSAWRQNFLSGFHFFGTNFLLASGSLFVRSVREF